MTAIAVYCVIFQAQSQNVLDKLYGKQFIDLVDSTRTGSTYSTGRVIASGFNVGCKFLLFAIFARVHIKFFMPANFYTHHLVPIQHLAPGGVKHKVGGGEDESVAGSRLLGCNCLEL